MSKECLHFLGPLSMLHMRNKIGVYFEYASQQNVAKSRLAISKHKECQNKKAFFFYVRHPRCVGSIINESLCTTQAV